MKALRLPSVAALLIATLVAPRVVLSQAYSYPSLQIPQSSNRDFTAALVSSASTAALLQWREAITEHAHFLLETGLRDPAGRSTNGITFVAGNAGYQLLLASESQPIDVLLTAGIGISLGYGTKTMHVPFGASIGHRFAAGENSSITPYVHPRISFDRCTTCAASSITRQSSTNVDVGFNFEVTPRFAVIVSGAFNISERANRKDSFGFGIKWLQTPLTTRE